MTAEQAHGFAQQAIARCRELANITDVPGETTRTFLSEGMRHTNDRVGAWMQEAGCSVSMDPAGNLRGVLRSNSPAARTFVLASHLDTVPDAGAFDGVLGVMMALALAEATAGADLPFHLELVAFSEEEGVRFGLPFIGSRAFVGELTPELLTRTDRQGVTIHEAIAAYGLDTATLASAQLRDALGYLEFHIEQGPALESEGLPIAVVETIAGQSRWMLTFTGRANHAGTTPMHLRQDALSAAAEWISEVERVANSTRGLVATVGSISASPNAGNVIAGEVQVSLDVRSALDGVRADAVEALLLAAQEITGRRTLDLKTELRMQQDAVPMDRDLLRLLEDAVDATGTPIRRIVSGAGHDAMIVAPHMPAAMLFLRTPGGLSHHPGESVLVEDVSLAMRAGELFLHGLAEKERAQ